MKRVGILGAARQAAETSGYYTELGIETASREVRNRLHVLVNVGAIPSRDVGVPARPRKQDPG